MVSPHAAGAATARCGSSPGDAARAPLPGPSGSVAGAGARVRIGNAGNPVG